MMRMSGLFLTAAHAASPFPARKDCLKNRFKRTAKNLRHKARASLRFALRRRASKSIKATSEIKRRSVSSLSWPPRGKLSSAQNRSVMGHIPTSKSIIQRTTRAQISQAGEVSRTVVLSLFRPSVDCSSLLLLDYSSEWMRAIAALLIGICS